MKPATKPDAVVSRIIAVICSDDGVACMGHIQGPHSGCMESLAARSLHKGIDIVFPDGLTEPRMISPSSAELKPDIMHRVPGAKITFIMESLFSMEYPPVQFHCIRPFLWVNAYNYNIVKLSGSNQYCILAYLPVLESSR